MSTQRMAVTDLSSEQSPDRHGAEGGRTPLNRNGSAVVGAKEEEREGDLEKGLGENAAAPKDDDDATTTTAAGKPSLTTKLEKSSSIPLSSSSSSPSITPIDNPDSSTSESSKSHLVTSLDESEDPKFIPKFKRWIIVLILCFSSTCVTFDSTVASFTEPSLQSEFHISHTVSILTISLFVEGLGLGPLLLGPLSEYFGRWPIYAVSYTVLWGWSWGVAFAPNAASHLAFRFIAGFSGSAFLSVAGGSIGDLFADREIAYPMAVYTMSPFLGPVLGPAVGGFINQNVNWRWTYYVVLIWQFIQLVLLVLFTPETYPPVLIARKAKKLRDSTGDPRYCAPLDEFRAENSLWHAIIVSCYKPFEIMFFEPMALLLDIWSALLLGILYLTFQAFPLIFRENHGFNTQMTGLTFLGLGMGMLVVLAMQPWLQRIFRDQSLKYNGKPPLEVRLIPGFFGALLPPFALLWFLLTIQTSVHWIVPILASIPLGSGIILSFTSIFTYLVVAYRTYAASAMAGNSFVRSAFAAGFPLFAQPMFERLGQKGGLGLLTGLLFAISPLPFVFYRYGARIRKNSRFATS